MGGNFMKQRSKWEFGVASVKRDGILYGLGYSRDEVKRPYIAVVNLLERV